MKFSGQTQHVLLQELNKKGLCKLNSFGTADSSFAESRIL